MLRVEGNTSAGTNSAQAAVNFQKQTHQERPLLRAPLLGCGQFLHVSSHVPYGLRLLELIYRKILQIELVFEGHDTFDRAKRIDTQVIPQIGVWSGVVGFKGKCVDEAGGDSLLDCWIAHGLFNSRKVSARSMVFDV